MSKELEALKYFKNAYNSFLKTTNDMFCKITISREQANEFVEEVEAVEKKVKALEIIKPYLRLSDNWLQTKVNIFNIDNFWVYVKEITDEEQLNLLKEVLE